MGLADSKTHLFRKACSQQQPQILNSSDETLHVMCVEWEASQDAMAPHHSRLQSVCHALALLPGSSCGLATLSWMIRCFVHVLQE